VFINFKYVYVSHNQNFTDINKTLESLSHFFLKCKFPKIYFYFVQKVLPSHYFQLQERAMYFFFFTIFKQGAV